MILVGSGSVHNMDYISDDAKVARRHAEITSVVRRRNGTMRRTGLRASTPAIDLSENKPVVGLLAFFRYGYAGTQSGSMSLR